MPSPAEGSPANMSTGWGKHRSITLYNNVYGDKYDKSRMVYVYMSAVWELKRNLNSYSSSKEILDL